MPTKSVPGRKLRDLIILHGFYQPSLRELGNLEVCLSKKRMNCLGYMVRERGHRRVPEPPESMTGKIPPMFRSSLCSVCWRPLCGTPSGRRIPTLNPALEPLSARC
jgi:hypothetical protein